MVGLPLILFEAEVDEEMGDQEYLSRIARGDLPTGVLKNFIGDAEATFIIATVPTGKDWYLKGWSIILNNSSAIVGFEYPTGTEIDGARGQTSNTIAYNGVVKGNKITAGQTVTITSTVSINKTVNLAVIEVDTGASLEIP